MSMPFPGMDPYLEHPVIWEGFHARLIPAIANLLQPRLDPRYIASVEERVFIEGPQPRVPDDWVQQVAQAPGEALTAVADADTAVIVDVDSLEIHQKRVEILDLYNEMKLVGIIEALSPTNKATGEGRRAYLEKQQEILGHDCHLIEIDLLRAGEPVFAIPEWRLQEVQPFDYLVCVHRWQRPARFELYARRLAERLPRIAVPLAEPDRDVTLDVQAAVEQVYQDGRYAKRLRYDEPCRPGLSPEDQRWADDQVRAFRTRSNGQSTV